MLMTFRSMMVAGLRFIFDAFFLGKPFAQFTKRVAFLFSIHFAERSRES